MTRQTFLLMIAAIPLSSCHYYYKPNVSNVPLFLEKDEYRVAASVSGGEYIKTLEVQGAYSITNHLAVMSNFMYGYGGDKKKYNYGRGRYLDAAIGYYKPFGRSKVFELYGGLGGCSQFHQYSISASSNLFFIKPFIQPSIGFTSKAFDIALSSRISRLSFHGIQDQSQGLDYGNVREISLNRTSFLMEPALTLRGGWKYTKLQLQLTGLINLKGLHLPFENHNASIGLYFALPKRYGDKPVAPIGTSN